MRVLFSINDQTSHEIYDYNEFVRSHPTFSDNTRSVKNKIADIIKQLASFFRWYGGIQAGCKCFITLSDQNNISSNKSTHPPFDIEFIFIPLLHVDRVYDIRRLKQRNAAQTFIVMVGPKNYGDLGQMRISEWVNNMNNAQWQFISYNPYDDKLDDAECQTDIQLLISKMPPMKEIGLLHLSTCWALVLI